MNEHEQFAEDLALLALGVLGGEERAKVEAHLAICAACKLELEQLRGDGALLGLSTAGPKPPQRARQKLLDAVARDAKLPRLATEVRPRAGDQVPETSFGKLPRRSRWGILGWAAAAAILVFAISLEVENTTLRTSLLRAQEQAAATRQQMEELRRVAAPIIEPEAQHITLVAVKTPPQPQGKAFYLRNRSSLLFMANNLSPLPPQKAYELWLIPAQGAPIPAGVFKPDAHGSATVVNPPLPKGVEAKAFAITIENESGANSPTMPIVMMGTGE